MTQQKQEAVRPRAGDYWEFKLPGKPKRVKEVDRIGVKWGKRHNGTTGFYRYVHWARAPKGRYSGLSLRLLLKYGQRMSTKAERDAHLEAQIEKARQKREQERQAS
jgi:hypothetical protein